MLAGKKFGLKKCWPKIYFGQKNFLPEKKLGQKKICQKKIVKKKFGQKNVGQKSLGQIFFLHETSSQV